MNDPTLPVNSKRQPQGVAELIEEVEFSDLFNIEELQYLQDLFADATGVATVITLPDGTPLTKPSNFSWLSDCAAGKPGDEVLNDMPSFTGITRQNSEGPGNGHSRDRELWHSGAAITVGGIHMADWLIGKVKTGIWHEDQLMQQVAATAALRINSGEPVIEDPGLSAAHLDKVSKMLSAFVREISDKANKNLLLKRQVAEQAKMTREMTALYENLSVTLSAIGDGVITTDLQGFIVSMNPVAEYLCGWSCSEAVGRL